MKLKLGVGAPWAALVAVFAIGWAISRAEHQSITLDEADTYLAWVATDHPNHWTPHSNNHLLNSLLMRWSTATFGLSELTVRLPALIGGILYVVSCFFLSGFVARTTTVRVILQACLVLNPFLSDYYVAARGYGLAIGLWACAVMIITSLRFHCEEGGRKDETLHLRAWIAASVLLALSFTANFSYAFIVAATWASLLLWTLRSCPSQMYRLKLTAASALPGSATVLALPSWTLLHWPKGELWDGTRSLQETLRSVAAASVHEPSGEIVNPLVEPLLKTLGSLLIPTVTVLAAAYALLLWLNKKQGDRDLQARVTSELAVVVGSALVVALILHWTALMAFGLLLPKVRTATYLVPTWTITVGSLAAIPRAGFKGAHIPKRLLIGLLATLAIFYLLCLRRDYFYEWFWCADSRDAYAVISRYSRAHELIEVPSRSPMTSPLEFYRLAAKNEQLTMFRDPPDGQMPLDKDLYALFESSDGEFIRDQHLRIIFRGRVFKDFVIAARPR